jgi:centromere protein C
LTTSIEVAYAAEAIEMRDIGGSDFRFAKTLTLPFFGSGMVDLPPGGAKRVKNSRKMQLIFFVYYGRVTVDVGTPTTSFSIGKGGMWQVPRGKNFSSNCILFDPSLPRYTICLYAWSTFIIYASSRML